MQDVSKKPSKTDDRNEDILFRLDMKSGATSGDIEKVVTLSGYLLVRGKYELHEQFYPFEYQVWSSGSFDDAEMPAGSTTRMDRVDVSLDRNSAGTYILTASNGDFNLKMMMNPGNYCYCDFFRRDGVSGEYYVEEVVYSGNPIPYTMPAFNPHDLLEEDE